MKGNLAAAQQLRVLTKVWGKRSGYVFLPWIDGQAKDKRTRRESFHEGRAYKWPADREAIHEHLKARTGDDLYFTPNMFKGKRRVEELVMPERVLYADLDPVNPEDLTDLRPTIAWESSPDRYQAIWLLDTENEGATRANRENHRLTSSISADPSGWDPTQLLRVPGRPNFKFEYTPSDEPNGVEGRGLLWSAGPRYTWAEFADLPAIGSVTDNVFENMDEEVLSQIDRHDTWRRIKLRLPHRVRELYLLRVLDTEMDRSEVMWDIARSMADAGCTSLEIAALLRPTVWNKFAGRSDEIQRLMTTAQRAVSNKEPTQIEDDEPAKPASITWLSDITSQPIPRPSWLVKDIWTNGACGFISGAPKSYKSWIALDMAVSVSTGSPFLNQPGYKITRPKPVLYIQEEDDVRMVMDRLQQIVEGKVPERYWGGQIRQDGTQLVWEGPTEPIPMGVHIQTGFIASDEGWQTWLDEVIQEHKFGLVIIDTLGTTAGDIDTDTHGDLMNRLLKPLKVLAQKHNTAVCVVHHNRKSAGQGRAGNDMLGSVALHAWVDCALYARSKDIDGTIAVEREAKLAQEVAFRLRIPYMHVKEDGTRQLWDPEIILPGVGEEEPQQTHTETTQSKPPAYKEIARKLKFMGKRGADLKKLSEVLDMDPQPLLDLLLKAQEAGLVKEEASVWTTQHPTL